MKALHRTFAMLLLALLSVVSATAQEPKGADIEFQSTVVDFGSIEQDGSKQMMRLSFTNTGDVPLVVTEVIPWWSSGLDLGFSVPWTPVRSLYQGTKIPQAARHGQKRKKKSSFVNLLSF